MAAHVGRVFGTRRPVFHYRRLPAIRTTTFGIGIGGFGLWLVRRK